MFSCSSCVIYSLNKDIRVQQFELQWDLTCLKACCTRSCSSPAADTGCEYEASAQTCGTDEWRCSRTGRGKTLAETRHPQTAAETQRSTFLTISGSLVFTLSCDVRGLFVPWWRGTPPRKSRRLRYTEWWWWSGERRTDSPPGDTLYVFIVCVKDKRIMENRHLIFSDILDFTYTKENLNDNDIIF